MNKHRKAYTEKRYQQALDHLGGVCACGSTERLHFHHVDPATKTVDISSAIRTHCWSWERLVVELTLCVLLCEECHKKEHASRAPHGTAQRYWRGCRCAPCTAANSAHNLEYKRRRAA